MRLVLTVMFMLFMFTTTQVAAAFAHCDEPSCAHYTGDVQKKANDTQKDDSAAHCTGGCHHVSVLPHQDTMALRTVIASSPLWVERLIPESALGEALTEPPSLA